ncbi:hypothetical protein R1flu_024775 [Riccia fluitans]|uniref:Uncharacterized protein n=1 Tax=Riccia fluitans TaxID=41844 RepID=A0ABD1XWU0_9MARC
MPVKRILQSALNEIEAIAPRCKTEELVGWKTNRDALLRWSSSSRIVGKQLLQSTSYLRTPDYGEESTQEISLTSDQILDRNTQRADTDDRSDRNPNLTGAEYSSTSSNALSAQLSERLDPNREEATLQMRQDSRQSIRLGNPPLVPTRLSLQSFTCHYPPRVASSHVDISEGFEFSPDLPSSYYCSIGGIVRGNDHQGDCSSRIASSRRGKLDVDSPISS